MNTVRQQKVQKFEDFVDRRLKPDLVLAISQRDKLFQRQKVLYPYNMLNFNHFLFLQSNKYFCIKLYGDSFNCQNVYSFACMSFAYQFPSNSHSAYCCYCLIHMVMLSSDLRKNIENLQRSGATSLQTMVNIGSEVYAQADVPDTRHIFVDVGLGFHVEFTWSEALEFISVKEARIARQIEECTQTIASIKARIKLVCEGIRELLELPSE